MKQKVEQKSRAWSSLPIHILTVVISCILCWRDYDYVTLRINHGLSIWAWGNSTHELFWVLVRSMVHMVSKPTHSQCTLTFHMITPAQNLMQPIYGLAFDFDLALFLLKINWFRKFWLIQIMNQTEWNRFGLILCFQSVLEQSSVVHTV